MTDEYGLYTGVNDLVYAGKVGRSTSRRPPSGAGNRGGATDNKGAYCFRVNVSAPPSKYVRGETRLLQYVSGGTSASLTRQGQNLVIGYSREQVGSGPEALAAQVAAKNPDVILLTDRSSLAFVRETEGRPIVTIQNDPSRAALQKALHGLAVASPVSVSIPARRFTASIALLLEVVPGMSRLACISGGRS